MSQDRIDDVKAVLARAGVERTEVDIVNAIESASDRVFVEDGARPDMYSDYGWYAIEAHLGEPLDFEDYLEYADGV